MKSSKLTYNVFVVQSLSLVWLFVTPWTAAHLSFSISLPFTCNVYMIYHSGLICISLIALRLNHLNIGIPFSVNWVFSFEEHPSPWYTAHRHTHPQELEINNLLIVFQAIMFSNSSFLILIVLLSGPLCVLNWYSFHLWFLLLPQSLESNNAIKEVIIRQFYFLSSIIWYFNVYLFSLHGKNDSIYGALFLFHTHTHTHTHGMLEMQDIYEKTTGCEWTGEMPCFWLGD